MHPVLQRIYAARGACDDAAALLRLARLHPPAELGGIDAATALLAEAIAADRHIVVVGDFDCDGATGTATAVLGLRMLGAGRVSYQVPHRVQHGYGLSPALVEVLAERAPDLVLTVDNGIACLAGVAAARARGWRVVVSDHHLPGPALPAADAIVNPNAPGCAFPSKCMAGVGVVFYLLLALRRRLQDAGTFAGAPPDLAELLDLVAVGTVADLVRLDYNNRVLVAAGLRRLREGRCRPGLRALAEVAGRRLETLSTTDIGFALAPRLNAAGRLDDMGLGIECLLADDPQRAREYAAALDGINAERRALQQQMVDEADRLAAAVGLEQGAAPLALSLFDPGWHPGVVGLVASKLKERLHRPVVAFAPADEGADELRGSARSIPGFHIRDALAAVDAAHPGLIPRFGGHAMAAGLTLPLAHLERFGAAFQAEVERGLDAELLEQELASDGPLAADDFCRELAELLRAAGPWGQGFPEPVFDNAFEVLDCRELSGGRHLRLRLRASDGGPVLSAIRFGWDGVPPPARIHAAYQLEPDDFRERRDIQLLLRHIAPA
ncbi:single-stranded-DNA-specific exonuclease RecJ [Coralloluteibacterium stylophorae]|uniref:Single-stranded-DNA-specific exonuclease RecJ n=2 Tax=Coralloluteibacterium stylophorae TaxID=1776034 RepID=A0A8J7VVF1_9GAMM|nr:single-stranded-DNA-specific exonuclease RecJ [Coralloluteibacterium stylophorae]MBS7455926.1 single-stranded-DNA-specific exonuclease RecJ [Coralloluteibacterium stylophorae]